MTTRSSAGKTQLARSEDLHRILPDLDDAKAIELLNLSPTVAELEEALLRAAGQGDIVDRAGHTLTGTVARIVAILTRDEERDV